MRLSYKTAAFFSCLCLAVQLFAAPVEKQPQEPVSYDVALSEGNILTGQLVDTHNAPLVGAMVEIIKDGQIVATATTETDGTFQAQLPKGGAYQVVVNGKPSNLIRAWSPGTAPPTTRKGLLVVAQTQTVNGQAISAAVSPLAVAGVIAVASSVLSGNRQKSGDTGGQTRPPAS